jgi:hypothetical protein
MSSFSFPEHHAIGSQLGDPMALFAGGSDTVAAAPGLRLPQLIWDFL